MIELENSIIKTEASICNNAKIREKKTNDSKV